MKLNLEEKDALRIAEAPVNTAVSKVPGVDSRVSPHGATVVAAATTTAWRSEQERQVALASLPRSRAPIGFFLLSIFLPSS